MSILTGPNNDIDSSQNISGVITDGLQIYYDAGRYYSYPDGGFNWKDLSGNNRDLTFYSLGGTTYSSNPPQPPTFTTNRGGEFTFDGINDFGRINNNYNPSTVFTVSAWVKTSNSSEQAIISHCSGGPVNFGVSIASGRMKMWYYVSSWNTLLGTPTTVANGQWNYCVWVINGTNARLFLNNNLTDITTMVGTVSPNLQSVGSLWGPCNSDSYGAGTDGPQAIFNGQIGIIMVHNKALTDTEINTHWEIFKRRFGV